MAEFGETRDVTRWKRHHRLRIDRSTVDNGSDSVRGRLLSLVMTFTEPVVSADSFLRAATTAHRVAGNIYHYRYSRRMDAAGLIRQARTKAGMTQTQLARAAGTSQPAVAAYESGQRSPSVRTLNKLIRATGATLQMSVAAAPAAGGELLGRLRSKQPQIRGLARERGITNLRVFGSAARGTHTLQSDIDLLVDFDVESKGVLPLVSFAREVSQLMGRPVDVSTPQMLKSAVRRRALVEAVPL